MNQKPKKHVLVAVLDWGLGHATRCIPVINYLLGNCEVSIAGNGSSLELLKKEFPELKFYILPGYNVKYSTSDWFFTKLLFQAPRIFSAIRKEHNTVNRIIREKNVDFIISDNRYGCYSNKVPSVFMCHQLNIQLPIFLQWSKKLVDTINNYFINRFKECWVPDDPSIKLSGILSEINRVRTRYIGLLSRFSYDLNAPIEDFLMGIVSGPEPQRTIFENKLVEEFKLLNTRSVLLSGKPGTTKKWIDGNIEVYSHLPTEELHTLISKAKVVISRSGYSSIMDFVFLKKKKVILIPTPGQTEQEYLAIKLNDEKIALTQKQDNIILSQAMNQLNDYTGFNWQVNNLNLLKEAVDSLLNNN